jgi:NAD(P)-dependent dehydrogenase (short-subunit alcohol dehydrogenase family)
MKTAIITGAGSGIGLATAVRLSEMGIAVLGVGRDSAKLADLTAAIGDRGPVATLAIDITADEAPKRIVEAAVAHWGHVDFLINNAGAGRPKPVDETSDEELDASLGLMLRAPFRLIRETLPHMPQGAAVINVTSTFALVGGLRGGAYSAAKAGLTGLTQHIACHYGAHGVRANCVAPGVTPTPMTEGRYEDAIFQKLNDHMTPHYRLATVDDVAGTIAFLCSPAGEFINGQTIAVDGGWSSTKYLSDFARSSTWVPA